VNWYDDHNTTRATFSVEGENLATIEARADGQARKISPAMVVEGIDMHPVMRDYVGNVTHWRAEVTCTLRVRR